MCRTVPISVAVSAALEGTLWRCAVIVSASWQSVLTRPLVRVLSGRIVVMPVQLSVRSQVKTANVGYLLGGGEPDLGS